MPICEPQKPIDQKLWFDYLRKPPAWALAKWSNARIHLVDWTVANVYITKQQYDELIKIRES